MESKNYLVAGDVVTLNKDLLENVPNMLVIGKVNTSNYSISKRIDKTDPYDEQETTAKKQLRKPYHLSGLRCRWFDKDHRLCEGVFNTKDLKLVQKA